MTYEFPPSNKCVGRAHLKIEVDLWLFSVSVTISCEKKFAGSGGDPSFGELMGPYEDNITGAKVIPWDDYCVAFEEDC
jgi:hypothetical protein